MAIDGRALRAHTFAGRAERPWGSAMKMTGSETLDHAPRVVAEWLDFLQDGLGWPERGRAFMLLRETLHVLRDYLTVTEAAALAGHFPVLIRGLFYEGWQPDHCPVANRSREDFLARVGAPFKVTPLYDPELAVSAVFALLRQHVSAAALKRAGDSLRAPLGDLWG